MPTHVALFRAINVGAHARVGMAELCAVAEKSGLGAPRAVLQSGNLVFDAEEQAREGLELGLEAGVAAAFGFETRVLVRATPEWRELVESLPFVDMARTDPAHVVAMPLRAAPDVARQTALRAAITGNERVAVIGATAYIAYPDGIGRSRLTAAVIERHLGTVGTARNWRTVLKIGTALGA